MQYNKLFYKHAISTCKPVQTLKLCIEITFPSHILKEQGYNLSSPPTLIKTKLLFSHLLILSI